MDRSRVGEAAAAVAAALAPHDWQGFPARLLARHAVGAMDRHTVVAFLSGLPGTEIGPADAPEPAAIGDARVDALVRVLDGQDWGARSLSRLSLDLSTAVAAWHVSRDTPGRDLRLDGI